MIQESVVEMLQIFVEPIEISQYAHLMLQLK